jgi:hypothetical protein
LSFVVISTLETTKFGIFVVVGKLETAKQQQQINNKSKGRIRMNYSTFVRSANLFNNEDDELESPAAVAFALESDFEEDQGSAVSSLTDKDSIYSFTERKFTWIHKFLFGVVTLATVLIISIILLRTLAENTDSEE